jgi:hypothetical protein
VSNSEQVKTGAGEIWVRKVSVAYVATILCTLLTACGGGDSGSGSSDSG